MYQIPDQLIYDKGTYETDLKQSTAPLLWTLDPVYAYNCNACLPNGNEYIGNQGVSVHDSVPLVDVDSDLKLLTYKASRDPRNKYQPRANKGSKYHFKVCDNSTQFTRLSNPPCSLKGTGVNRFTPLCVNPQSRPGVWNQPTRIDSNMLMKDLYEPCLPKRKRV